MNSKTQQILKNNFVFLFVILPLFVYKSIPFFENPRIWAEEGTVYFVNAVKDGFSSVFEIQQGYFSIIPNVVLYFSTFFNYKYVPLITTTVSSFFWLLPYFLICNINSKEFKD